MTDYFSINLEKQKSVSNVDSTSLEGSNSIDNRASDALSGSENKTEAKENVKPLNARNIDYTAFYSDEMKSAKKIAERSLNEVNDLARSFNADFPAKPYSPNYEDFPKPAEFEQFKKKDRLGLWEDSVTEWVEDCKQDMETQKSNNLANLANLFAAKIDRNFIVSCSQFGITQQIMYDMFEQVQGDMQKFNEGIRRAVNAANNAAYACAVQGEKTREELYFATGGIHAHIDDATNYTTFVVGEAADYVADQIYEAEDNLSGQLGELKQNDDEIKEANLLREEVFIGLNNAPKHIFGRIKTYLERKGYQLDEKIWSKTPIKENNAVKGIIDNMSLEDLKEIRRLMKDPSASDPFIH